MSDFTVKGLKEIEKALKQLEPKLVKKTLRNALRKGAKITQQKVKQNAPVGEEKALKKPKVRAGKRSRTSININVELSSNDADNYHAAFVELGTDKQEGQGFMRAAYDETKEQVKQGMITDIRKGIEDEVKKVGHCLNRA